MHRDDTQTPMGAPERIEVRVSSGRSYPVLVADGLLHRVPQVLDQLGIGKRRVVVSTPPVWQLLHDRLQGGVSDNEVLLIPDGERFKTLATVGRLYEGLVRIGADRASVIITLGGGVVGDTGGFTAATFLRGIPVVHVPSTLLAQVDSAIGGKVGVNLATGKNLVGAFHPPSAVLIDPGILATLPRREFRAGLYEVVKYAVIASPSLFDTLETRLAAIFARDADVLPPVIAECCRIKARVVTEDEHERGLRRTLNFGHTTGHAIEAITRYRRFRHGEAIAYGMLVAGALARQRGVFATKAMEALEGLVAKMGPLPPIGDLSASDALEAIRRDKKVIDGTLHFVLPTAIGATAIATDVNEAELVDAMLAIGFRR